MTHNGEQLDDAQLLVSELVTNAVSYGAAPLTVEVDCVGTHGLYVAVSDAGPGRPCWVDAGLLGTGGRGVALVDMLSAQWGVIDTQTGKRVWFRLGPGDDHRPS